MSRNLVALLEPKLVQHAVGVTRPSLAGDGVDVLPWRTNGAYSAPLATVFLDSDIATTLSAPTGGTLGPELWGYRLSQWWRVGYLNDGSDIALAGNLQGFAQSMNIIGIFERLVVCGTASGGAVVTARLVPLDSWTTA